MNTNNTPQSDFESQNQRPLLLLVDGSSYWYRAYHALPDLRSAEGFPTGALHGMVAMMRRLHDQFPAAHAACVFDAKGPTFRSHLYADYKAHRAPMPPDLVQQIAPIREVVGLLGWPILEVQGVEADDVIGTLAHHAVTLGYRVLVSTGDKDMAQLVGPHVGLVNTMSNEQLDEAGVEAKFGVPPQRIIDYLTLMGDTADNVPGVEKVGAKTAAKWIAEYGGLEGVITAAPDMKGVLGQNLRKALDWLPMARQLVTIKTDCDLSSVLSQWPQLDELMFQLVNQSGLHDFYERYTFRTWLKELDKPGFARAQRLQPDGVLFAPAQDVQPLPLEPDAPPLKREYETLLSTERLELWLQRLQSAALVAFDTETTSLDPMTARLVGLSVAITLGEAAYIPVGHNYPEAPAQMPLDAVLQKLRPWLENASAPKLGQNTKFDAHVLANHGIRVQGYIHDTLLQSYVLEAHRPHNLENLALRHLNRQGVSYESLCGKGAAQIPFAQVNVNQAAEYSGEDSEMTLHLHQTLWPQIQQAPAAAHYGLQYVYEYIEMPTSAVLLQMERRGVLIDSAVLQNQSHALGMRLSELEQEAYALAGGAFNLGSPKQVGEVLFQRLGLPVKKKTATGAPSTDEEVLQTLAADYPLPAKLLEHRGLSKLKSTYTDKLPQMVNAQTGRVHTSYAQAVAVTGRLSSNDPNLQNIPIRTPEGRRVREAFIAPPGCVLMSADYSQIELRVMAHISGDENLLKAFAQGLDVHRVTASEVFGVAVDAVNSEQRRFAKVINFGLIYGMGAYGLANNLGVEPKVAKDYIEQYFARFAGVKRYMDQTRTLAAEQGYVETVFGRRLYLQDIRGGSGPKRAAAERQAINAPMQGTAADLIKLAMIHVEQCPILRAAGAQLVMQVHDELVLEVPHAQVDHVRETVLSLMAGVADFKVPLLARVGVGPNWALSN